jgi:hypothetical protein
VNLLSFIPFSSLQSLLSKLSYETFCYKHCKERDNYHNLFLSYAPNSFSFFPKKKKIIIARRLAFWQKQAGRILNVEKIKL